MKSTKRKPIFIIALTAIFCLAAVFALAGCDKEPKTLEDYLADSPSAQQEIEDTLSGLNNSDMDVAVSYAKNQVIITCDMKTAYKGRSLKAMKKSYKKYLKKHLPEPMEKAVASIEQDTGITGVKIQVIIHNGDGREIWSQVYPIEEDSTEETSGEDSGEGN